MQFVSKFGVPLSADVTCECPSARLPLCVRPSRIARERGSSERFFPPMNERQGCRDFDITEIDITESDVTETDITESDITESDITESDIT